MLKNSEGVVIVAGTGKTAKFSILRKIKNEKTIKKKKSKIGSP